MLLIREVLIAKPGHAGELAKLMKEMASTSDSKMTVMLDLVTDFNKIVIEHFVESLADFEKEIEDYKKNSDPKLKEKMKGYTELYQTGKREIYKIVE